MSTKSDVLAELEKRRGETVSGQALAEALGVSRTAVWKAIRALRGEGYPISAGTNSGYLLEETGGPVTAEGIRAHLPENLKGREIFVFPSLDSTNTELKRRALNGAPHGALVAAGEQTAGRGRAGRSFYSPAGAGLYMSLLLRPREAGLRDPQMVTVAAAAAVRRAVEALTGLRPRIKWVNDLYLNGRKVCGILTEASWDFESGGVDFIVLGVGVNVATEGFPEALGGIAGSLEKPGLSRNLLAAEIIRNLEALLGRPGGEIIEEYKAHSLMFGKNIRFSGPGGEEINARVLDINDRGNLVVTDGRGETRILSSGEVHMLPPFEDG